MGPGLAFEAVGVAAQTQKLVVDIGMGFEEDNSQVRAVYCEEVRGNTHLERMVREGMTGSTDAVLVKVDFQKRVVQGYGQTRPRPRMIL